jgi:hypothetical protein
MINQWKQYLQQIGAHFDSRGQVVHFGQQKQSVINNNILVDLSHLSIIEISGHDALSFLQNQLTNDVREVNLEHSQLNAWCNPKGRVIMNFRLFKRQETYYIVLPQESATQILERLRKYVLRSEVKMAIADELLCIGMSGEQSVQTLTTCLGNVPPKTVHTVLTQAETTVINVSELQHRYLVIGNVTALKTLWECAVTMLQPVSTSVWHQLEILSGIPQIVPTTTEEFVPQMINLQTLGGVSFKKGCYPGQEVVARMQYLATQKRQMYLLKATNATTIPFPGDLVYANTDEEIGTIVNVEPTAEGGYIALVVLPVELDDKVIRDQQGIILQQSAFSSDSSHD